MNAKTLQAITRHGESLLLAFPNATEKDPVALCKKLRRIENVAHQGATAYCNGETFYAGVAKFEFSSDEDAWERFAAKITKRVQAVLGDIPTVSINASNQPCASCGAAPYAPHKTNTCRGGSHRIEPIFHVNADARGAALKLNEYWTYNHNGTQYSTERGRPIYTDMGGYGILAPDLNQ